MTDDNGASALKSAQEALITNREKLEKQLESAQGDECSLFAIVLVGLGILFGLLCALAHNVVDSAQLQAAARLGTLVSMGIVLAGLYVFHTQTVKRQAAMTSLEDLEHIARIESAILLVSALPEAERGDAIRAILQKLTGIQVRGRQDDSTTDEAQ